MGGGVCPPGCPPHFVWKGGTASGAFGPLGGILGQKAPKKNNFGPKLLGQLFPPAAPPRGAPRGTQGLSGVRGGVGQPQGGVGRGGAHGVGCSGVGRLNRFSGTKRNGKKLIRHLIRINKAGD